MRNIKIVTSLLMAVIGVSLLLSSSAVLLSQETEVIDEPIFEKPQVINSISLTNADIRSVMMYLASFGDINIVVSPQVETDVTVKLTNVTWRQALDIILDTYGLVGVEDKGYIRIAKAADYFAEKKALEQYNAEQASLKNLRTRIVSVKYNVASEISKAVVGLLSVRGTVATDERTNSLILRDLPENLDRVEELINQLDKETRQVKISAQLLEIESRSLRQLGLDWRILNGNIDDGTILYDALSDPDNPEASEYWPQSDLQQNTSGNMVGNPSGNFYIHQSRGDFLINAVAKLMESTNKVKVIAHPEITTVDNVEAFIQMGQKIPIKQLDDSGNTVIKFYDVGIQLRVTPHVTSENRILLNLKPERSSYLFDPNGIIINTQNAETNVVVGNGQTTVIAGLTKQEELKLKIGIPILKDIPILGYLFSYDKTEVQNKDLVIFVTPTIVDENFSEY